MNASNPEPNPLLPIAVGFFLLSLPLFVSALVAGDTTATIACSIAGTVLVALGALIVFKARTS